MGLLLDTIDETVHPLRERHLIGRWEGSDLTISDSRVSSEHCLMVWHRGRWLARDLGSRNGTTVDQQAVVAGEGCVVREGARLAFGSDEDRFRLIDDGPPRPFAQRLDAPGILRSSDGTLVLPSEETPVVTVLPDRVHGWVREDERQALPAYDQEVVRIEDAAWRLVLPRPTSSLPETTRQDLHLDDLELVFRVSRDQESIVVEAHHPRQVIELGSRVHNELLLDLARVRLDDADLKEAEAGWIYQDQLESRLKWSANRIYLTSHRARRQLGQLGVADAHRLVERRPQTGQIRLGVSRIRILPA